MKFTSPHPWLFWLAWTLCGLLASYRAIRHRHPAPVPFWALARALPVGFAIVMFVYPVVLGPIVFLVDWRARHPGPMDRRHP